MGIKTLRQAIAKHRKETTRQVTGNGNQISKGEEEVELIVNEQ
jgi:hypothetical protein